MSQVNYAVVPTEATQQIWPRLNDAPACLRVADETLAALETPRWVVAAALTLTSAHRSAPRRSREEEGQRPHRLTRAAHIRGAGVEIEHGRGVGPSTSARPTKPDSMSSDRYVGRFIAFFPLG